MQALDVVGFEIATANPDMWRTDLTVKDIYGEGGDEEDTLLRHHRYQLGVFVQVAAMLDGIHISLDRRPQAWPPEGVTHHPAAERMRFLHQRLHLIQVEGGIFGAVTWS